MKQLNYIPFSSLYFNAFLFDYMSVAGQGVVSLDSPLIAMVLKSFSARQILKHNFALAGSSFRQ